MAENTKIEWCDHTWNPWHGCVKVSPGCAHCYAETLSKRFGRNIWGPAATTPRLRTGEDNWREPWRWNKAAREAGVRRKVFCASMSDLFEDHPQVGAWRREALNLMISLPHLDWLLLTKRPENVMRMCAEAWGGGFGWPPHIWIGTSVENQDAAEKRIPELMRIPARVRFLSVEPLLEPVSLLYHLRPFSIFDPAIHWVIVGGESGLGARQMEPAWVRMIQEDCELAGVPFFFKQWGGENKKANGRLLDGREWNEMPSLALMVR